MRDELIERLAKVLHQSAASRLGPWKWEDESNTVREYHRNDARAVIAELEEMVRNGWQMSDLARIAESDQ